MSDLAQAGNFPDRLLSLNVVIVRCHCTIKANSCKLESLALKARQHFCPCSCQRQVKSIEFFVFFYIDFAKDFGE